MGTAEAREGSRPAPARESRTGTLDTGLVGHVAPRPGLCRLPPPGPARPGRAHVTLRRHSAAGRERGAFRAPPARAGPRAPTAAAALLPPTAEPRRARRLPRVRSHCAAPGGSSGCFKTGPRCSPVFPYPGCRPLHLPSQGVWRDQPPGRACACRHPPRPRGQVPHRVAC